MKAAFWTIVLTFLLGFSAEAQNTLVLDRVVLERQRKEFQNLTDPAIRAEITKLVKKADKLAAAGTTFNVMKKAPTPPSGDKHDYMSQAPYWWADPSKPDGLPYIRRDGERNPELSKITDHTELDQMLDDSELSALAYYFTGEERYANHAANVLRAWFLDPKTKQNPNLKYAQFIPGVSTGRGIGLIETRQLYRAIDAAILISGSKSWPAAEHTVLKEWFGRFLEWITESPQGKDEADERNNHGTHYDVQVVAYAIFTGKTDLARKQIETTKARIASQIEPDGRQPHELARTLSWGYVNMNLVGFFTLARLGESVGGDLWNYSTPDGRSIRKAFEWMTPFASSEREWSYKQIKPRTFDNTVRLLRIGAVKYNNPKFSTTALRIETVEKKTYPTLGFY